MSTCFVRGRSLIDIQGIFDGKVAIGTIAFCCWEVILVVRDVSLPCQVD
jgi:hypothetical protein